MDKVSVFESSDFGEIRVMVINDQPWFVGSDIASALGYSNASKAVLLMLMKKISTGYYSLI